MSELRPTQTRMVTHQKTYIPQDLKTATHIFVRAPPISSSLSSPYRGPYPVLKRTDKTITILRNNKPDDISIDRTIPAYVENDAYRMPKCNLQIAPEPDGENSDPSTTLPNNPPPADSTPPNPPTADSRRPDPPPADTASGPTTSTRQSSLVGNQIKPTTLPPPILKKSSKLPSTNNSKTVITHTNSEPNSHNVSKYGRVR